ncbi:MAG: hypothetical protein KDJ88_11225 [Bauldia sp.]|nr:hypothetical protein [Bauldia sp.]
MTEPSTDKYRNEFRELGIARVRNELVMRRWHKDKLAAARSWVERQDVDDWMASNRDKPPKPPRGQSAKKWAGIIVVVFGLIFAAERLLRMMGHL